MPFKDYIQEIICPICFCFFILLKYVLFGRIIKGEAKLFASAEEKTITLGEIKTFKQDKKPVKYTVLQGDDVS